MPGVQKSQSVAEDAKTPISTELKDALTETAVQDRSVRRLLEGIHEELQQIREFLQEKG